MARVLLFGSWVWGSGSCLLRFLSGFHAHFIGNHTSLHYRHKIKVCSARWNHFRSALFQNNTLQNKMWMSSFKSSIRNMSTYYLYYIFFLVPLRKHDIFCVCFGITWTLGNVKRRVSFSFFSCFFFNVFFILIFLEFVSVLSFYFFPFLHCLCVLFLLVVFVLLYYFSYSILNLISYLFFLS